MTTGADTIVSRQVTFDPRTNSAVTTTVAENLSQFPTVPDGAIDVVKEISSGVWRVTYKEQGDQASSGGGGGGEGSSTAYSYEIRSTLSTEPLKTHPYFRAGGKWALGNYTNELKLMANDPSLVVQYAERSDALGEYAGRLNDGIESYLAPSVTLHISRDEIPLPDLSTIGKISRLTNTPTVPIGCTWMLTGCQSTALQNGKWRNVYEYRLSGPDGWDTGLYQ